MCVLLYILHTSRCCTYVIASIHTARLGTNESTLVLYGEEHVYLIMNFAATVTSAQARSSGLLTSHRMRLQAYLDVAVLCEVEVRVVSLLFCYRCHAVQEGHGAHEVLGDERPDDEVPLGGRRPQRQRGQLLSYAEQHQYL